MKKRQTVETVKLNVQPNFIFQRQDVQMKKLQTAEIVKSQTKRPTKF